MIESQDKTDPSSSSIILIDFGLATSYTDEEKHVEEGQNEYFQGNYLFASHNAFEGKTLSRRDDLISLTHLLCYFLIGKPNWTNQVDKNKSVFE